MRSFDHDSCGSFYIAKELVITNFLCRHPCLKLMRKDILRSSGHTVRALGARTVDESILHHLVHAVPPQLL